MELLDLSGMWKCEIPGCTAAVRLPGTLEQSGIGYADSREHQWHLADIRKAGIYQEGNPILTRLTRSFCFEGQAKLSRVLDWEVLKGKRIFFECERARHLLLEINGRAVPWIQEPNISTPYVWEVTEYMTGHDELTLLSDNSYPGWPYEAITRSSAAADETQTNWNGILGYIRLRMEKPVFFEHVSVYPKGAEMDICLEINAAYPRKGKVSVVSPALQEKSVCEYVAGKGKTVIWLRGVKLREDVKRWNAEEGNIYEMTVSEDGLDSRTVSFGIRDFRTENGSFWLNDCKIFLRSETNCAVFPETGYAPMEVETWRSILSIYREYGVNCVRFHSHCPPEAAFTAADEMGMLMQPELSHWNPKNTFSSSETRLYYYGELKQILRMLANHPSFVMLTLGNELRRDAEGYAYMVQLLEKAREWDNTRLYANGSNTEYGFQGHDEASDFYTAMSYLDKELRAVSGGMEGWLNHMYPNAQRDYREAVDAVRKVTKQPVFSFEVGQYEVLPDFDEIELFRGITRPDNLIFMRSRVKKLELSERWKEMVEASGELALLCYRAEAEAALRTEGMAGISLLGLQDFPGQGSALVGMLNAHFQQKPFDFAKPERFRAFFKDVIPLVLLPKYTYCSAEMLDAEITIANYGKQEIRGEIVWSLTGEHVQIQGFLPEAAAPAGELTKQGNIKISLEKIKAPVRLTLRISLKEYENEYPIWIYPAAKPVCPKGVFEARMWNQEVMRILEEGGTVYLSPDSTEEAMPNSVGGQFSTNFWSVCSFIRQSGCMGQLIDWKHPVFSRFPTEKHTNWQWWPMAVQRVLVLPEKIDTIVLEMDVWEYMRPMAQLFEARCLNGKIVVSSMGLQNLQEYPEARALQAAIYDYMDSPDFEPAQRLSPEWIDNLFTKQEREAAIKK